MKDELPNQIYLQYYDENGEDLLNPARNEVTWCVDRINESDAVYILVTLELAVLLERLANMAVRIASETEAQYSVDDQLAMKQSKWVEEGYTLAARIREALALEVNDED